MGFLAFDFGAESARGVFGELEGRKLQIHEVHRFPTRMMHMGGHVYWNVYRFFEEMVSALGKATTSGMNPESVAVDTWGVDFGFLAKDDTLLRIPYAYRDPHVIEGMHSFHKNVLSEQDTYKITGISRQPFNTLYHLFALQANGDRVITDAERLLFMPDLLNYMLCGEKKTEFTIATTSQLYNPTNQGFDESLLSAVGIKPAMMNDIIQPGNYIGALKEELCNHYGLKQSKVVSVCSHDTGSAIVAVPALNEHWAFISSGTWSLMGVELEKPVISDETYLHRFSNEGGAEGTYRLLKTIMGLWLLQQCKSSWAKSGENYSYTELVEMAKSARPFAALIDPDHLGFFNPEEMPAAIDQYCLDRAIQKPDSIGGYVRCILESLAFKYRMVLDQITSVSGKRIDTIHIIGGGTHNKLLCQLTANATGKRVVAGPAEGTAVGNLLMQARACGYLHSLAEIRDVVRNTFEFEEYLPEEASVYEKAYDRFREIEKLTDTRQYS